tara:strand:+ start:129 stop:1151 length:1023 start_codon:yes stop_codon:yes gene_type:complete
MLEYILLNITGGGDVNYAFIPLLLTAGQAALSIAGGVSAANAAKEAAERAGQRASEDAAEAANRMRQIEQGNLRFKPEEFKMSNKLTEAFDTQMSRAAEDVAAESREQALATAASQGAQGVLGAVDVFGDQARKDAIAGLTGRAAAMQGLGQQEQTIDQANIRAFNLQAAKEFDQADAMARAAQLGERAAEDSKLEAERQKNQALVQGIGGAVLALGGQAASMYGSPEMKKQMQEYNDQYEEGDTLDPDAENFDEGGRYKFRDGGDVMVTDGEFSHKTNKKAIVDEETGIKEGEMTGQEALVFNDEHVAIIEELTNRGDEEMLMKFMRELLSQPQFQDEA